MDINDIRVQKMRMLVEEFGGRKAFSEKTGIAYTQLNNYIGKTRFKNIGSNIARRVEETCGKPHGWMDNLDEMRSESTVSYLASSQIVARQKNGVIHIPVVDKDVSKLTVDSDLMLSMLSTVTDFKDLFLMRAYGDSMGETFSDGDMLFVDQGVKKLDADAIYAFRISQFEEIYTKRLQQQPDGSIRIISDNKRYEPYVAKQGDLQILGRVVLAWKKL